MKKEAHKGQGHRSRLRKRFLESGFEGFLDYEIIELLLTLGTPRRDCKDLAKLLMEKYGRVMDIFYANPNELKKVNGLGDTNIIGLMLARSLVEIANRNNAQYGGINIDNIENIVLY